MEFAGVLVLVLKISECIIHNFVEFLGVIFLEFPGVKKKPENSRIPWVFKKPISSILFCNIAEPMVTTQCFIALKSSKSIQLLTSMTLLKF